jgi:hypothetical protein
MHCRGTHQFFIAVILATACQAARCGSTPDGVGSGTTQYASAHLNLRVTVPPMVSMTVNGSAATLLANSGALTLMRSGVAVDTGGSQTVFRFARTAHGGFAPMTATADATDRMLTVAAP